MRKFPSTGSKRLILALAFCVAANYAFATTLALNFANWSDNINPNTGTTFNVGSTNPQGANGTIAVGDLLIGEVVIASTVATTDPGANTWPSGWTRVVDDWNTHPNSAFGDPNYHYSWAWKIATSGDLTGSYAVSWTNAAKGASWALFDYVGANATTPIDASGNTDQTTSGANHMIAPSITPTGTTDINLIIGMYAQALNPYTLPAGFTQRALVGSTSSDRPDIIAGDIQLAVSGATGTRIINSANGVPSAISIAIAPASGGGGNVIPMKSLLGAGP